MNENDSQMNLPRVNINEKTNLLGSSAEVETGRWVQTDRKAHEEWGKLAIRNPRASALLHQLVARMGSQNAVVVSRTVLGEIMGCSVSTIKRCIKDLKESNWIQVVQVGTSSSVNAYVINDRVAWGQQRSLIPHLSVFSATVISSASEQLAETIENKAKLHKIPVIFSGERQLPMGEPADPPVQGELVQNDPPSLIRQE